MKKQMFALASGTLAFLTGCTTAQMMSTPFYEGHDVTYTGRSEDRVNLWPLAYWREPVGSVLWPMLSFSDDHFAFRPFYSQYKEEYNLLWPLGQYDAKAQDGHFFPVFWGTDYFDVFPILWNHGDIHLLFPLAYYNEGKYLSILPLLWWNIAEDDVMLLPVFGHSRERDWLFPLYYCDDDISLVTPLAGVDKLHDRGWIMPLAYWDKEEFTTPVWRQTFNRQTGETDSWMIPPLLTGGGVNDKGSSYFYSPIVGFSEDGNFVLPLWYKNQDALYSLPLCQWKDRDWETTFVPPLLSWHESSDGGAGKTRLLMGLYGHDTKESGATLQDWLAPLYYYDGDRGDFQTLLFGSKSNVRSVDYWWLTHLVGTTSGATSGFWLAPLVSWSSDKDLPRLEKEMNASRLDGAIAGKEASVIKVKSQSESEKLQFCLGAVGYKRTITMDGGPNKCRGKSRQMPVRKAAGSRWREGKDTTISFTEKVDFGYRLLFGGERWRVVNFDYDTKAKVFDGELEESDALCGLVWSSRSEKWSGHEYAKRSLFWRLYHEEVDDSDSTTDIFPFITHDEKKGGYTKTSFFWRLFRYEYDPKAGTSLDLFFIPLKRP